MVNFTLRKIETHKLNEVEKAQTYCKLVQNPEGEFELTLPTEINEKIKPYLTQDFYMDIVKKDDKFLTLIFMPNASDKQQKIELDVPYYEEFDELKSPKEP